MGTEGDKSQRMTEYQGVRTPYPGHKNSMKLFLYIFRFCSTSRNANGLTTNHAGSRCKINRPMPATRRSRPECSHPSPQTPSYPAAAAVVGRPHRKTVREVRGHRAGRARRLAPRTVPGLPDMNIQILIDLVITVNQDTKVR